MPANPDVAALVAHATKVSAAQTALRDAMAKVAAEVKAAPAPAVAPVKRP
jgi:hypothetical protein